MPETSIIIRTFNEEKHIGNLLQSIKEQDYKDCEIIIVDSGSTDNTLKIARNFTENIVEIESRNFTFGYSLNVGCEKSQGKYIVLASAHIIPIDNKWLSCLLAPFQDSKVGMVYGRQMGGDTNKFSEKMDFNRIFRKQSYPNNANTAFRKELWQDRPFDECLFGLEDIEFAGYVKQRGFLVHYESRAAIYHIHNEKWPQVFNRYRREAIAAARIGLPNPPQAKTGVFWLAGNILRDLTSSLPNISLARVEEIGRFRYYQWKGSRQGWHKDRNIDINRDKYTLFYPATGKAVVIKNKKQASIEQVSLPEMKPGDILIQVNYVGICRTDLEIYEGSLGYYKNGLAKYPIVPGHEFSGTIVHVGANNKYRERFKAGDLVVGECILSRTDDAKRQELGVINHNGAYSNFIVMPGQYIHKLSENVDLKIACLTEPLAVALRAIKRSISYLKPGSKIAVIGVGAIGNLFTQALALKGYHVSIFDKNQERVDILKGKADILQGLDDLKNFDLTVEATGSPSVLKQILGKTKGGTALLLLGFPYGNFNYNFENVVSGEKVIFGSLGALHEDFEEALELLPKIDTRAFFQAIMPLENFNEAWQLHKSAKHLKIILKP